MTQYIYSSAVLNRTIYNFFFFNFVDSSSLLLIDPTAAVIRAPSALCCVSSSLTIISPSKTKNINLTFRHYREVREGVPLLANVSLWLVNSQVFTSRCMCDSWVLFRNTERTECCCHVILASAFVRKTRPPLIPFNNDTFLGFRLSDCRENKAIDGKKWTQSFSDKYTNGRLVLCEVFKCGKWL